MPQISPMKWLMLNFITQSSIIQLISFLSTKKVYTPNEMNLQMSINKLPWKW